MRKRTIYGILALMLGATLAAAAHPASAAGSCPVGPSVTPSATGATWTIDPADKVAVGTVKTCGTWSTTSNTGHIWVGVAGYGPGMTPLGHSVNGAYVAVGNDRAGNPDGSNGKDSHCTTNRKGNRYTDDKGKPCKPRKNKGPYACVATDGGASYGPKNGFLICPVNQ